MRVVGHTLANEVLKLCAQEGCALRWESEAGRVVLWALHDPKGYLEGAIAAAEAIEAETCGECRGPGRRRKRPGEPARRRCAKCAAPGETPIETRWTVPANAVMTTEEAAARGWMDPGTCRRLRCCGWGIEHATALMNHDERETGIEGRHGWNHLARALLRLVLASQEPERWRLGSVKEKWGHITAIADPASGWRHGALWLFSAVSGKTCSRCGQPAVMRDHCKGHFGVLPLCDACETQWQEDEQTPDGHIRRIISDEAAREGREVDVDAELARLRDRRT